MQLRRSLGTFGLVFVIFFTVSGGAFTMEGLVASVGPGMALLLLVVIPVVWATPEALLIGELSSMLPEEGGYYRWVHRAFGPFWAFQNGWLTWLYSLVDMAIYPVLFTTYLSWFMPGLNEWEKWALSLAMIWGATAINLRGAQRVGRVSIVAGLVVLGTFLAIALAAVPRMGHIPWHPFVPAGSSPLSTAGVGLSIVLWNYIGWDNASTVEGEIIDAGRTYPRALAFAVPMVTLAYLIPVTAALSASDWTTWREGGWPEIAHAVGGSFGGVLAPMVAVAGVISALALFNALLLAYSRVPAAMAEDGLLPRGLATTDERGTPRKAVLAAAGIYSVFALIPFSGLVVADVVFYAMALMLEFAALITLRRKEPALRGVIRVPVGPRGIIALALMPGVVLVGVIGLSLVGGRLSAGAIIGTMIGAALGPVAYRFVTRASRATAA